MFSTLSPVRKRPRIKWHDARFEERNGTARVECAECGRPMWLPPSKVGRYLRCSQECVSSHRERARLERQRSCQSCGATFIPRPVQVAKGQGRFCSQKCNTAAQESLLSEQAKIARTLKMEELRREGKIRYLKGLENPRWKGGPKACVARRRADGRESAEARRYRQANPDKVKNWRYNRRGRKYGRLPNGTVERIGKLQRWKCAICTVLIRREYHVDHIKPLARGGRHTPRNIQLLCPPCNGRKSARDPIDHMRSLGRLL